MADKTYRLCFVMKDGSTKTARFTVPESRGIDSIEVPGDETMEIHYTDGTIDVFPFPKGEKGDAPVQGVDYWTEADRNAMVDDVVTRLITAVILAEREMSQDTVEWDSLEMIFPLDLSMPLIPGNNYTVTIDGVAACAVAEELGEEDAYAPGGTALRLEDMSFFYREGGTEFFPTCNAVCYVSMKYCTPNAHGSYDLIPFVVKIVGTDISWLPSLRMAVTFENGTTGTYRIYGEAVGV